MIFLKLYYIFCKNPSEYAEPYLLSQTTLQWAFSILQKGLAKPPRKC